MHKTKTHEHYFFSETTVAGENYKRMIRHYAMPTVRDLFAYPIFQQDSSSRHHSVAVWSYFDTKLPKIWISREVKIAWPRSTPNLTPLEFFLCCYVKDFYFLYTLNLYVKRSKGLSKLLKVSVLKR